MNTIHPSGSGTALSAYVSSLLDKTGTAQGQGQAQAADTPAAKSMKAGAQAAQSAASHSARSTSAQQHLEQDQQSLAKDLRAALSASGVSLEGPVEFSVGSGGGLAVHGSEKDQAAVRAFLKNDTRKPGFVTRLASLTSQATQLSTGLQQTAAISQAAKYGKVGNVMSLYSSYLQQHETAPAVFSLSASSSSLSYPGVLASKA